jgi:DNA-binding transcriptional ArsR family regulator
MIIDKESLIQDLRSVKQKSVEENMAFTREYYLQNGKYSRAPINRIFGSWNKALIALGIEMNTIFGATKDDVRRDIMRLLKEHGKISSAIQRNYGQYSQPVIDRLFGSFTNMLRECGLRSVCDAREMSDNELIDNLRTLYTEFGYINTPLIENASIISVQTYINRFGSITKVYQLLDLPNIGNVKNMCKNENFVVGIITGILGENPIRNWSSPELVNPDTKSKLYVDAFYVNNNIAVEYDGEYHFSNIPFFSKGRHDKIVSLDAVKDEYFKKTNIPLLRIGYKDPVNFEYIKSKIDLLKSQ